MAQTDASHRKRADKSRSTSIGDLTKRFYFSLKYTCLLRRRLSSVYEYRYFVCLFALFYFSTRPDVVVDDDDVWQAEVGRSTVSDAICPDSSTVARSCYSSLFSLSLSFSISRCRQYSDDLCFWWRMALKKIHTEFARRETASPIKIGLPTYFEQRLI